MISKVTDLVQRIKNKSGILLLCLLSLAFTGCAQQQAKENAVSANPADTACEKRILTYKDIRVGAERLEQYLPLIKNKTVAIVANQSSLLHNRTHLVDTLLSSGIKVKKIFCPEHGFRGTEDAGAHIKNQTDKKTGLPIISLYGNAKKPSAAQLKGIDVVLFDLQDVGARFYTYISTMSYVMEACAENQVKVIVLDRPNPNGFYVDGPVLKEEYKSFVGMHEVPVVHGMTVGEYARMVNTEGWLKNKVAADLTVVQVDGYTHNDFYQLPVRPSPNLSEIAAVYLYPSLCFFEGTIVSVGRGTDKPFQVFGHPEMQNGDTVFTPRSVPGASVSPMYKDVLCKGFSLTEEGKNFIGNKEYRLEIKWLIQAYQNTPDKASFFNNFFLNLSGTEELKRQIIDGVSEEEIRRSWQPELDKFKATRKKYLLYKDFE